MGVSRSILVTGIPPILRKSCARAISVGGTFVYCPCSGGVILPPNIRRSCERRILIQNDNDRNHMNSIVHRPFCFRHESSNVAHVIQSFIRGSNSDMLNVRLEYHSTQLFMRGLSCSKGVPTPLQCKHLLAFPGPMFPTMRVETALRRSHSVFSARTQSSQCDSFTVLLSCVAQWFILGKS
jgi:hypothetical protein